MNKNVAKPKRDIEME